MKMFMVFCVINLQYLHYIPGAVSFSHYSASQGWLHDITFCDTSFQKASAVVCVITTLILVLRMNVQSIAGPVSDSGLVMGLRIKLTGM